MNYRADIDGLRAVAVLLVIISHFGFLFAGGFIGVDVFFVISGFVITFTIYPKIKNKKFKFSEFWMRRIRRLMPVLFVVLFSSAILFSFILIPSDLIAFFKNIIAVILSVSNIYLWVEYGGYFAGNSQEAPLLHTWSLAVEEQYYLFWPFLLICLVKIFNTRNILLLVFVLFVVSAIVSQKAVEMTMDAAYYLMPTRFFELLCGSWLAVLYLEKHIHLPKVLRECFAMFGIGMIVFSAIWLNHASAFPGYNALYPVIGTALLILAPGSFLNQMLAYKPVVYVGKISYSLYLWHWPILVFLVYTEQDQIHNKLIALAAIFGLSVLSFKYIEQPFRSKQYTSLKKVVLKLFIYPSLILSTISIVVITFNGLPERFPESISVMDYALKSDPNEQKCLARYRAYDSPLDEKCLINKSSENKILLLGDSHANHLQPFLGYFANELNYSLQEYTLNSCLPLFDLNYGRGEYQYARCRHRNNLALQEIRKGNYELVVLSAAWPRANTIHMHDENGQRLADPDAKHKLLVQKLRETVNQISESGSKVVVFEDTPGTGFKKAACPLKRDLFNSDKNCLAESEYKAWMSTVFNHLDDSTKVIDLRGLLCVEDNCRIELSGVPIYRDSGHLNKVGAVLLAQEYEKEYGNLLSNLGLE